MSYLDGQTEVNISQNGITLDTKRPTYDSGVSY